MSIHPWLQNAYGETCMGVSNVRCWVEPFEDGNTDIADHPHVGCPWPASTEKSKGKISEPTGENWCMTVREMAAENGKRHHIIQFRRVWKACTHWSPYLVTEQHRLQENNFSSQLLEWYAVEGDNLFCNIVMTDDSWFFTLIWKQNSRAWNDRTHHHPWKRSQNNAVSL